ncbi:endonuclease/exonuclease/phosphatase family protein [Streptomyces silaceus]|uniref:endonuclease/exonuclease/phosphatase family protein n=1 Tax=Streptomyces silaceus TaxID=545123 RepID=UPI00099ECF63|nr:endonuclease/exonuclease/phosphatase family protein [Streptomyces silaceus]
MSQDTLRAEPTPSTGSPPVAKPHGTWPTGTWRTGTWRTGTWRRGRFIATAAVLCALLMAFNTRIPNGFGNLGSLLQTVLPWMGLSVVALLAAAVARRSALAGVAVLVPAVTWCSLFAGTFIDKQSSGGDVVVVGHNVHEENRDPRGTARALAAAGADVVALEELSRPAVATYERELARTYRYSAVREGIGLWSKHPLRAVEPVEIMPWTRALRATVDTPKGPVALYVAHLASVRVLPGSGFTTERRNAAAGKLADAVRAERLGRVVVVGDFNGTTDDSALGPLTSQLRSAQQEAGAGFGFTWPASFPVVRLDQVMVKGVTPVSAWTLPATGSDHLPVAVSLRL